MHIDNFRRCNLAHSSNKRVEFFHLNPNRFTNLIDGCEENFIVFSKQSFGLPGQSGRDLPSDILKFLDIHSLNQSSCNLSRGQLFLQFLVATVEWFDDLFEICPLLFNKKWRYVSLHC